ncbi:MAG: MBL fold metallo-hydrolase [Acidobacteria bacterium]|nr:MBL fold metallo-hydrolase [Acidobacteriota bacterium]
MEFEVLGIGDAFTSLYYNTSFLIRSNRLYLVDAPQALFRLLRERNIDPGAVNDVIITHIHGDHTSGLETLILWKKYVQKRRLTLYASQSVYRQLCKKFFPRFAETFSPHLQKIIVLKFEDYVDYFKLRSNGVTRLDHNLWIEIRENWHPTPTLGLKVSGPLKTIGISGDTCYRPSLLKRLRENGTLSEMRYEKLAGNWLWSADVIYHDAARAEPTSHTLEKDLLALPEGIRKKIRLVHISDDFAEGELKVAREGEMVTF